YGRERIFVSKQHGGKPLLNLLAHFADRKRPTGFHQRHATGFGKSRLASAGLAVDQFQQILAQDVVTKQIGQSRDGLLQRTDALHDVGALPHELAQFLVGCFDDFLHMRIAVAQKVSVSRSVAAIYSKLHDLTPELYPPVPVSSSPELAHDALP